MTRPLPPARGRCRGTFAFVAAWTAALVLVGIIASSTTGSLRVAYAYDAPAAPRVVVHEVVAVEPRLRHLSDAQERSVSPPAEPSGATTTLSLTVNATNTARVADDVVVLGKYPEYVNLADDLGARRFSIPDEVWSGMSESQRWTANQTFLDRAIARGSEIRLASPPTASNLTGYYAREIDYLLKQGYTISGDGTRMLPPGG